MTLDCSRVIAFVFTRCSAIAETALQGDFAPTGAGWSKISSRRGRPTNHSSSQKTSFVWYKNLHRSFFHFFTNHAFDRQTDIQTGRILFARPRLHSMRRSNKSNMHLPSTFCMKVLYATSGAYPKGFSSVGSHPQEKRLFYFYAVFICPIHTHHCR